MTSRKKVFAVQAVASRVSLRPESRVGFHWKVRGGERAISVGAFLQQQGAAWGEAIVGRPLTIRPEGHAYAEAALASAERAADEAARRSVTVSDTGDGVTESDTGGPAIEPEPRDAAMRKTLWKTLGQTGPPRRSVATSRMTKPVWDPIRRTKDAAGAAERFTKRPTGVTVSVLAYSDASGEHQVLYPDGKRVVALVSEKRGGRVTRRVFASFCLFVSS